MTVAAEVLFAGTLALFPKRFAVVLEKCLIPSSHVRSGLKHDEKMVIISSFKFSYD